MPNRQGQPDFGKKRSRFRRTLYLVAGTLSLGLGILGIPLPLLPTTPFLLLSAWLYSRSSERFYHWLINHRTFGKIIRNYRDKGGVEARVKAGAIALLWVSIAISCIWAVSLWWVRGVLVVIATGVTWHIASLKTLK